ncbi:MAG: hypothetical protein J6Z22_09885, partial [Lachnospiraceae bacterium]|nr:hypothetical protein [Lachnospiraceae bacterium]
EEDCHDTEGPFDKKSYKNPTKISGNYSFMICPEGLLVSDAQMAYLFDFSGKITAQIPIPRELLGIQELEKQLIIDFKISNDKLYLIYGNRESGYYYRVLYCPMEDVYQGNITWTDAYRIQGLMTYEKYQEIMMQEQ